MAVKYTLTEAQRLAVVRPLLEQAETEHYRLTVAPELRPVGVPTPENDAGQAEYLAQLEKRIKELQAEVSRLEKE